MSNSTATWTVLSMLEWATSYFEKKDVKNPRLSIEWLLAETLGIKRLDLYLNYDRLLSSAELDVLRPMIKKRAKHEPLQYIIGFTEFYNAKISVSPEVLIPRIETEQLIDIILDRFGDDTPIRLLDIGTGSGCIPIAIKLERPSWEVWATDVSKSALKIAQKNAHDNQVNINLLNQDLFRPEFLDDTVRFDIIISNPPYVLPEDAAYLDKEVLDYEPHLALFCKNTENIYGALENYCRIYLSESGIAYFEIHENEGEKTAQIFDRNNWQTTIIKDYANKDRFVQLNNKNK